MPGNPGRNLLSWPRLAEIRILQQESGELLVLAHQFPHVVLDLKARMDHRPIVGCTDEREQRHSNLLGPIAFLKA